MKKTSTRPKSREKIEFHAKLNEVILPSSKLKLCPDQLHNLNFIFQRKLDESRRSEDTNLLLAKSVSERLVQRLVCGAGMIDSRFSSKFLITLHNDENNNSNNVKYLIRIDSLSLPVLYPNDPKPKYSILEEEPDIPAGYAKIQLHDNSLKDWTEFTNSLGYLRRDRIQAKFVELLAKAAGNDGPASPLQVDESTLCGSPGKVVDAESLHYILHLQCDEQIFYGAGGNSPRYPDPRDLRLAIVDEPGGIRLRIEFLSPVLANISINVRLLVAVGVDSWPGSTDFPFRVPLGHSDCLLYYTAAQTGMYLVGFGVHSAAWQIRLPGAEHAIINHYSSDSAIKLVSEILSLILEEINQHHNRGKHSIYRILNKYILRTVLFYELESDSSNPTTVIVNWSPLYISTYVLKILDRLVGSLPRERIPNYFFKKANLLANPGHLCEEDYTMEARRIQQYLLRLFDESLMSFKGNPEHLKLFNLVNTETMLLVKWKEIVDGLIPPQSTRGRRMCLAFSINSADAAFTRYTCRQLGYVGFLLKNMVNVKENIWQNNDTGWLTAFQDHNRDHPVEDIIYILVTIMEQAKDIYFEQCTDPKTISKLKLYFNTSTGKLIELVRRDKDITYTNITDDIMLVKIILKWLYKAIDQNKKCLAIILRPFMSTMFVASHAVSWHMEQIKNKAMNYELQALGAFCKLINEGRVTPAEGLMDAHHKKWNWAKTMLEVVGEGSLRLIFTPERGRVVRHILLMPACRKPKRGKSSDTRDVKRSCSFNDRNYFNSLLSRGGRETSNRPSHFQIKMMSPLTLTIHESSQRGSHRCYGDIFKSMVKMHKVNMLQDIFSSLPEDERRELYEMVHQLSTEKSRRTNTTKWSNTLPSTKRAPPHAKAEDIQTYTPTGEEGTFRLEDCEARLTSTNRFHELMKKLEKKDSLIGSCRAARMKEDNGVIYFHENFKAKSLTLNYRTSGNSSYSRGIRAKQEDNRTASQERRSFLWPESDAWNQWPNATPQLFAASRGVPTAERECRRTWRNRVHTRIVTRSDDHPAIYEDTVQIQAWVQERMNSTEFPGTRNLSTYNVTGSPENFRFIPGSVPGNSNLTGVSSRRDKLFNGTGYYIEDEAESGLNDLQTLFLACFATLIPLIISLLSAFGIRVLWRKYRRRRECKQYDGVLHTEESVESVSQPLHAHLLNSDKQSAETHLTIDTEVCEEGQVTSTTQNSRVTNHSNTNGSIITMTLKNNHLIVETEERTDIQEDSRETKLKYSPSARGVFVVEVQQGARRSPKSTSVPTVGSDIEPSLSLSDQCALIHNPPDRYSDDDTLEEVDEAYYAETISPINKENLSLVALKPNTCLTQSDQSISKYSYAYSNQTEYDNGMYGYPVTNNYEIELPICGKPETGTKPKITSAILKSSDSMRMSIDIMQDDPLNSDLFMRTKSLSREDDDSIQEEQNRLGNCLPGLEKEETLNANMVNNLSDGTITSILAKSVENENQNGNS
ncbi:hypothetical protein Trydic_g13716 [Trypoxylus dichotomus]